MVVVAGSPNEDYGQKTSFKGLAHGLQNRASLTDHHQRFREDLLEYTLVNVAMTHLVIGSSLAVRHFLP